MENSYVWNMEFYTVRYQQQIIIEDVLTMAAGKLS